MQFSHNKAKRHSAKLFFLVVAFSFTPGTFQSMGLLQQYKSCLQHKMTNIESTMMSSLQCYEPDTYFSFIIECKLWTCFNIFRDMSTQYACIHISQPPMSYHIRTPCHVCRNGVQNRVSSSSSCLRVGHMFCSHCRKSKHNWTLMVGSMHCFC